MNQFSPRIRAILRLARQGVSRPASRHEVG
jgi:hypothetical protein